MEEIGHIYKIEDIHDLIDDLKSHNYEVRYRPESAEWAIFNGKNPAPIGFIHLNRLEALIGELNLYAKNRQEGN